MTVANSLIRKQVLNQRFARGLAQRYLRELEAMLDRLARLIEREPNNERLQAIDQDLRRIIETTLKPLEEDMFNDTFEFSVEENRFLEKVMTLNSNAVLRAPDEGIIRRVLTKSDMQVLEGTGTLTLGEALNKFSRAQARNISRVISDGVLFGMTTPEIAANVRALGAGRTKAQTQALTRTLVNFASSQARKAFANENKNVFDAEEWSAVLDGRTTLICAGRDGMTYPVGRGPFPPAHFNCRSVRIPILKKDFEKVSQKSNRENFDDWLREQDASFQKEYFSQFGDGEKRFELFTQGKLEIQRFRDETGKVYTLEQLQALYPTAFRDAGIEL